MPALVLLLTIPGADAVASVDGSRFEAQRAIYLQARQALREKQSVRYHRLLKELEDYPLRPYLEYRYLVVRRGGSHDDQIEAFIKSHPNSHLARRLNNAWLRSLFKRRQYARLINVYQEQNDVSLQCLYVRSHIRLKRSTKPLQPLLQSIWLHGKSRPKICDRLLTWYRHNGLDTELVWKRIELSMAVSNTRLARYLKRFLPKEERALVDLWIRVHRNPKRVLGEHRLKSTDRLIPIIVSHGITRLSRKHPETAYQWYQRFRETGTLDEQQAKQLQYRIALSAASDGLPMARPLMDAIPSDMHDHSFQHMRLRLALHERNWIRVLHAARNLPDQYPYKRMAEYWGARALMALGQDAESTTLFRKVAQHRDFYGFLAAERLGRPYSMNHAPVPMTELDENPAPALLRAREFHYHGDLVNVREEWMDLVSHGDAAQLNLAGVQASDWRWHEGAIRAFGKSRYFDDLTRRFPSPYSALFEKNAQINNVDLSLLFAISRRESSFAADTRSPVGAVGLMQLMPATARQVARALKLKRPRTTNLKEPALNIQLGSRYLADMLKRYHGNPAMALAAYNAGPGSVGRWLPPVETEGDIWIETIPFRETRQYVRIVLEYAAIYQWHIDQSRKPIWPRIKRIPPKP